MLIKLLKQDRHYLLVIFLIFLGFIIIGAFLPELQPRLAEFLDKAISEHFMTLANEIKGMPIWGGILIIFINNLTACITALITGFLLSPAFPLLLLIGNGVVIGLFQRKMELMGLPAIQYYLSLLPHGIFELPAFFISIMMAIQIGSITYQHIGGCFRGAPSEPLRKKISNYFVGKGSHYLTLVIGLLLIAATFEVTVSPLLLRR